MDPTATVQAPELLVGAYEGRRWAGLVFSDGPGRGVGVRFAFYHESGAVRDWEDWYWSVAEVGAHAPDGSYARVGFDLSVHPSPDSQPTETSLSVEWSRQVNCLILRAQTNHPGRLAILGDAPWDWPLHWIADHQVWRADLENRSLAAVFSDGTVPLDDVGRNKHVGRVLQTTDRVPSTLMAVISWAHDPVDHARDVLAHAPELLAQAADSWQKSRAHCVGAWPDLTDSISDNLMWMVLLQPENHKRYVPAGRRWIFPRLTSGNTVETLDDWTVFGWDSFFNALELAQASPDLAWSALLCGLRSQYDNGNVPNWRGRFGGTPDRSQPPVAAFAALKLHGRDANPAALATAYPYLVAWCDWWVAEKKGRPRREGIARGLLAWGSDGDLIAENVPAWEVDASGHQRAAWESGQDDLPLWEEAEWDDEREVLSMSAVDLCSYRALDLECLSRIARILHDDKLAEKYEAAYTRIAKAMNRHLWCEQTGMYRDRLPAGLSPRIAASNFLPLVAGIPTLDQAHRMIDVLCDEEGFWGEWMLPSISRDDPAFPDQQYWRGSIWPPMNYLVLQGLRRYGFYELASVLAWKGATMFLNDRRRTGMCRENFDARTGEGQRRRFQSWGPLFALGAVEEFVDVDPWDGLRVGGHPPQEGGDVRSNERLSNVNVAGHQWDVQFLDDSYRFKVDASPWVTVRPALPFTDVRVGTGKLSARCHDRSVLVTVDGQTYRPNDELRVPLKWE